MIMMMMWQITVMKDAFLEGEKENNGLSGIRVVQGQGRTRICVISVFSFRVIQSLSPAGLQYNRYTIFLLFLFKKKKA